MHHYEAVVGPVKGVYGKDAGVNKAREHSLLVSDRPPFVTILSLGVIGNLKNKIMVETKCYEILI